MLAQMSFTPTESKKLIAKAIAGMDVVKKTLDGGIVALHPSSSTYFIVEEIIGKKPDSNVWVCGIVAPKGTCVEMGVLEGAHSIIGERPEEGAATGSPETFRHTWIIKEGELSTGRSLGDLLEEMGSKDVYIKGVNALDTDGNVGVLWGNVVEGGTFGRMAILSFNGNKIITAGGGGCIVTDNEALAKQAKHLTTTAKVPHKWAFNHDQVGYNYRMPNLNAALLVAQLEQLDSFLNSKKRLAIQYKEFFENKGIGFVTEIEEAKSNYWLNALILGNLKQRDLFLEVTNAAGVMTRPTWTLMSKLPMFKGCQKGNLNNAEWLEDRVVNIPSSAIP